MLTEPSSLVKTLDNINEVFLAGEVISPAEGLEAALWIASRAGMKGSYRGMPAPTALDFEQGIQVFTGEKLLCASARHIMGQEAARAAWLLGHDDPEVRKAYDQATDWMRTASDYEQTGTFCCGRCSLAFWRHAWVGDFYKTEEHLVKGLKMMKDHRLGDGKWNRFPFYYAIYTLSEIDLEPANAELKYALPAMERSLKRGRRDVYSVRRAAIITKILERMN